MSLLEGKKILITGARKGIGIFFPSSKLILITSHRKNISIE
jgi:hypothetical protein